MLSLVKKNYEKLLLHWIVNHGDIKNQDINNSLCLFDPAAKRAKTIKQISKDKVLYKAVSDLLTCFD